MIGRWSRAAARDRWTELEAFNGAVLGFGIPVMGLWPLAGLIGHWDLYARPWVAVAVYVGSLLLPMSVWRLGPRGIGLGASLLSILGALGLSVTLMSQIDYSVPAAVGVANWTNSWGSATFFVLVFARPLEEVVAAFAALVWVCYLFDFPADANLLVLHHAPTRIGAVLPAAVSLLALITALRVGVRSVARNRALAAEAEQRLAVGEAVSRERTERFVSWEADVAPLLEDLAEGRRDISDPAVIARCRGLAAQLRAQLSAAADSLLYVLLRDEVAALRARGGDLTIEEVDVGFRLPEADRVMLARLIADLCEGIDVPAVDLTLINNQGEDTAMVMLSVTGAEVPDTPAWAAARQLAGAMLSDDSPTRWFWDATFTLESAPALPGPAMSSVRG